MGNISSQRLLILTLSDFRRLAHDHEAKHPLRRNLSLIDSLCTFTFKAPRDASKQSCLFFWCQLRFQFCVADVPCFCSKVFFFTSCHWFSVCLFQETIRVLRSLCLSSQPQHFWNYHQSSSVVKKIFGWGGQIKRIKGNTGDKRVIQFYQWCQHDLMILLWILIL